MSEMPERPDIEALIAARQAFGGFELNISSDDIGFRFKRRALAELNPEGRWLYWEMHSPYSEAACRFIVMASDAMSDLLAYVRALEGSNDRWRTCAIAARDQILDMLHLMKAEGYDTSPEDEKMRALEAFLNSQNRSENDKGESK